MKHKIERLYILIFLVGFGITGILATYIRLKPSNTTITIQSVPLPDPNKDPFYFDFRNEVWIYKGERTSRAKAMSKPTVKQQDIEETLQSKIPGYKENTYWGEDYEFGGEYED